MAKRKPADTESVQDASAQMALEQQPPDEGIPAEDIDAEHEAAEAEEQEPEPDEVPAPEPGDQPDDPEEPDFDREALAMILAAEEEVAEAERAWEAAQKTAKALKADFEEKVDDLRRLIRRKAGANPMPLFDQPKAEALAEDSWRREDVVALGDQAKATEDAWRRESIVLLCDHGVSETVYTKLTEAGIRTLGDLAAWTNSGKLLTDLPGVGEAKAEKIRAALDGYWVDRNAALDMARETVAEEDGEEAPDPDEEADDRPADNWREIPLSRFGLEPRIIEALEGYVVETVGDACDFFSDQVSFAIIEELDDDDDRTIKSALARFRGERGGEVLEGIKPEWLAPEPAEEPAPAPTKARRTRASA